MKRSPERARSSRAVIAGGGRITLAAIIVAVLAAWGRAAGPGSPWFAVTAGFTLLGLLDLARYFVRLTPPLGPARAWEARSVWYRRFGVRAFGALLRRSPLRSLNRRVYRAAGRSSNRLICELEGAEAAHTIAFLLVGLYAVLAALKGWWSACAGLAIVDVAVNLYPILHLRLTRARVAAAALRRPSRTIE